MDPTSALHTLRHPDTDPDDRVDAAHDLIDWLHAGGFVPHGEDRHALLAEAQGIVTTIGLER